MKDLVQRSRSLTNQLRTLHSKDELQPADVGLQYPGRLGFGVRILAIVLLIADCRLHRCRQPKFRRSANLRAEKAPLSDANYLRGHSVHRDLAPYDVRIKSEVPLPGSVAN